MDRTLAALQHAFELARKHGADHVIALATMAVRIAENASEFLERASAQGTPVAVLSGEDEARYGFAAVAGDPTFAGSPRLSIIDPGGHSTEMVVFEGFERYRSSLPFGSLGLRADYMPSDPPTRAEIFRASTSIDEVLSGSAVPKGGDCVVLGATGVNLIAIRESLTEWRPDSIHGAVLSYEEVGRAAGWLCAMTDAERAAVPGLEAGREKTIHLGVLILERCMHALRVESCRVSVKGWRHAVLADPSWWPDTAQV
jgi:exopolyphosphatase/guanosine-5'-triphosphate,3'-diphosphate pyrophosphatase